MDLEGFEPSSLNAKSGEGTYPSSGPFSLKVPRQFLPVES
jgi:hypothetical protein